MLISIGYIIGPVVVGVWFLGALIGDFGILIGGVEPVSYTHLDVYKRQVL